MLRTLYSKNHSLINLQNGRCGITSFGLKKFQEQWLRPVGYNHFHKIVTKGDITGVFNVKIITKLGQDPYRILSHYHPFISPVSAPVVCVNTDRFLNDKNDQWLFSVDTTDINRDHLGELLDYETYLAYLLMLKLFT